MNVEVSKRELMEPNARLKRVAGRQTLTLTHYGRKSGKPHDVTIWFVLDDDKLYIGTANVNRQWVRNVQKTPKIRLSIGGETFDGNARFLTKTESGSLKDNSRRGCVGFWRITGIGWVGAMLYRGAHSGSSDTVSKYSRQAVSAATIDTDRTSPNYRTLDAIKQCSSGYRSLNIRFRPRDYLNCASQIV
jgi:deazaflavin-dependent oxidoreductase (nitroreductase family)